MILKVISSSSVGNCYLLIANNGDTLIIECGVKFSEIKKALDFDLSKVVGCLVTHEHKDHCISINDILNAGINVFATPKTNDAMGISDHIRSSFIMANGATVYLNGICGFKVKAFKTFHDAADPVGFYINHPECGNVLFATDTTHIEGKFNNLNNIIIEANYSESIMQKLEERGNGCSYVSDRIRNSHMSIETCYDFLENQDLSAVNNIVLIHLSDRNSDAKYFKKGVEHYTGKTVTIADSGTEIQFNKTPF